MWFFILELLLILIFYTRNREWLILLLLSIVYAGLVEFRLLDIDIYCFMNTLLVTTMSYTIFASKTLRWVLDILPLVTLKLFELLLFCYPENYFVEYVLSLEWFHVLYIDFIYFITLIVNLSFDKIYCFKDWRLEYLKHYVFFSLTLINFIICW